jgi:hypothetical protein
MSNITELKHAAARVAHDRNVKIPDGFNADGPNLGEAARVLLRRVSYSKKPTDWNPASLMLWLTRVAKGHIIYTQGSNRMEGVTQKIEPPAYPHHGDCSSIATWAYWVSEYPDPNGLGYNGTGYTGTLQDHGVAVSRANLKRGDLVFYSNPDHVAVYVGNGRVIGFGGQGGPDNDPINYRPVWEMRHYRA